MSVFNLLADFHESRVFLLRQGGQKHAQMQKTPRYAKPCEEIVWIQFTYIQIFAPKFKILHDCIDYPAHRLIKSQRIIWQYLTIFRHLSFLLVNNVLTKTKSMLSVSGVRLRLYPCIRAFLPSNHSNGAKKIQT